MSSTLFENIQGWEDALLELHARLAPHFHRAEPRKRSLLYLKGLLSPLERRNGWQLAEHAGEATPDGMQRLLYQATWRADDLRDELRSYVKESVSFQGVKLTWPGQRNSDESLLKKSSRFFLNT